MTKILLVGGSGGIGKAITPILIERGYEVCSASSKDLNLLPIMGEETDLETHIYSFLVKEDPDVLINLSALSVDSPVGRSHCSSVNKQLAINVNGNTHLMRAFSLWRRERGGRFIYMSSILSERPVPGAGIYSASKAFNDHLIQVAAMENAKYGITFNSIQLGYFGEGLCERLSPEMKEKVLKQIPLRRWGRPEELVNLIETIINIEYLTGANLKLAGGL